MYMQGRTRRLHMQLVQEYEKKKFTSHGHGLKGGGKPIFRPTPRLSLR